ncbi:MAG: segregation/condensation protein A [Clostridiales bacterium]|nr:segregation/condensation protein A [Clostridiales bacterium]
MEIPVKLEAFEGPLDLLLHLIDKNKVNIWEIPIVEITDQYLEYVNQMPERDLDTMSEFLIMASTLLEIKCRMLLPEVVKEEDLEEDPRAQLVEQLMQYKMFKALSLELREKEDLAGERFCRDKQLPRDVLDYEPEVDLDQVLGGLTMEKLSQIFRSVLAATADKEDPIRSKFGKIEQEEVTVSEAIMDLRDYASENRTFRFQELLTRKSSKVRVIVTFLAILELIKTGELMVEQDELFDEILITRVD